MSIYSRLSDVYAASEAMNIGKNTKLIILPIIKSCFAPFSAIIISNNSYI